MKQLIKKSFAISIIFMLFFIGILFMGMKNNSINNTGISDWIAPPEADKLKNLLVCDEETIKEGKKTFNKLCNICHGDKGKGDGIAGTNLKPRPTNLTSEQVQKQTDGAIFWKITKGKPPMASYKLALSEGQRWQLVNYIRELSENNKK